MLTELKSLLEQIFLEVIPQDMFIFANEKNEFLFPYYTEGGIEVPDTWTMFLCKDIQGYTFKYAMHFKLLLFSFKRVPRIHFIGAVKESLKRSVESFKERLKDETSIKTEIANKEKINAQEKSVIKYAGI